MGIWIRIRVKRWIRIRIKDNIQGLYRLKIEPLRDVDTNNGGVEAQNGALDGLKTSGHRLYHFEKKQAPDPH